ECHTRGDVWYSHDFLLAKFFFGFGSSGSGRKRKKRSKPDESALESENVSALADDETFQKYWQDEGKASYEAFRKGNTESESEES
ncbi:MAG: hypothetical protein VB949_12905, partial [Pseudomonadales bacterium]